MSELRITLIVIVLLAAMLMSTAIAWRNRLGSVVLVLLSVLWILVDQDFEGPVLLKLSSTNGVTASDLVGVAGCIVAAFLWFRARRSH